MKIFLLLFCFGHCVLAQTISKNPTTGIYEYQEVVKTADLDVKGMLKENFRILNFTDIQETTATLSGNGRTSGLVVGSFLVSVHFVVFAEIKKEKYRLTFSNFEIEDKNGRFALENVPYTKRNWVRKINRKLPAIVHQIKSTPVEEDW